MDPFEMAAQDTLSARTSPDPFAAAAEDALASSQDKAFAIRQAAKLSDEVDAPLEIKALKHAEKRGVPLAFARTAAKDFEVIEREEKINSFGPGAQQFVSDPVTAGIVKNNLDDVQLIERAMARYRRGQEGIFESFGKALTSGLASLEADAARVPGAVLSLAAIPQNLLVRQGLLPEWMGYKGLPFENVIASHYDKIAKEFLPEVSKESVSEQIKEGRLSDALKNAVLTGIMNIPQLALLFTGAGFGASPVKSLGALAAVSAAGGYESAKREGVPEEIAALKGASYGAAEFLGEMVTLGWMKAFLRPLAAAGKEVARPIIAEVVKQIFKVSGQEALSEVATSAMQKTADYLAGEEVTLQEVADEFILAGFSGGMLGALGASGGHSARYVATRLQKAEKAITDAAGIPKQVEAVKPLAAVSPEVTEKLLESIDPEARVFIPASAIVEYFQSKTGEEVPGPKTMDELQEFAKDVGLTREEIDQAIATDADLEVQKSKYFARFSNTELASALSNKIGFYENGMSAEQADAFKKKLIKDIEYMRQEMDTQAVPSQLEAMRKQLTTKRGEGGAGFSQDKADAQIQVFLAGATQLSKTRGETVQEWFDRVNPTVTVAKGIGKKGAVQFSDSATLITLFQSADVSTFLHEANHIFVRDMKSAVEAGVADSVLVKDYETLKAYTENFSTAGMEKLATGFEAYLREGKAPSSKLASAFNKLSLWLRAIYDRAKSFVLLDDIRQVFDRMLAAEKEIEDAKRYYEGVRDLTALVVKAPPKKIEKAKLSKDEAERKTYESQVKKHLKAYYLAVGGKDVLKAQAAAEVAQRKPFVALDAIRKAGGLPYAAAVEAYGAEMVKFLGETHGIIRKKSRASMTDIAVSQGYDSAEDMVIELSETPRQSVVVNDRSLELQLEREQDIRDDLIKNKGLPGDEAYHEFTLTKLLAEAELLQSQIDSKMEQAQKKVEAQAFREAAQETVRNAYFGKAGRQDSWARAEQKFADRAFDYAEAGNWEKAFAAKKMQILHHMLVQESQKARDTERKIKAFFKTREFSKRLSGVTPDLKRAVLDIAVAFNLSAQDAPKEAANVVDLYPDLGGVFPKWVTSKQVKSDMRFADILDIYTTIKGLLHYGRQEVSSLRDARFAKRDAFIAQAKETVSQIKDVIDVDRDTAYGEALTKGQDLLSTARMTQFIFDRLDGWAFKKTMKAGIHKQLFDAALDAELKRDTALEAVYKLADPHFRVLYEESVALEKQYGSKPAKRLLGRTVTFNLPGIPVPEILRKSGIRLWTAERIITLALNTGAASNTRAIMNGYGLTETDVQNIRALLSESAWEAIQGVWDATNTLYPELKNTYERVFQTELDKVEAEPFITETSDGGTIELSGGYYPLIFDERLSFKAAEVSEKDLLEHRMEAVFRRSTPKRGMTKPRVKKHELPPKLSFAVWTAHVGDTTRFTHYAEVLRDLNTITLDPEWQNLVKEKIGMAGYKAVREWIKCQAMPYATFKNGWDKLVDHQSRMATIAILGLNVWVSIRQRLSILSAIKELGLNRVAAAAFRSDWKTHVGLHSAERWQRITELDPYMRRREKAIDRDIDRTVKALQLGTKKFVVGGKEFTTSDVREFFFTLIRMNDRATVSVTWDAAFNKYLETNPEDQEGAIRYARGIVQNTQPSSLKVDLNALQNKEGIVRVFMLFQTWRQKAANRYVAYAEMLRDGAITKREYTEHLVYELFFAAWGSAMISAFAAGKIPEWWELLMAPTETAISGVPLLAEIPGMIKYDKSIGEVPAAQGVDRAIGALMSTKNAFENDKWDKAMWDIARAVEFQFGVPATTLYNQSSRFVKGLEE